MDQSQPSKQQQQVSTSRPRRSLFGSGRSEDTEQWLQDLEKKGMDEKIKKWSFDFREGKPLEPAEPIPSAPSPSHVYEAVNEKEVPAFYRSAPTKVISSRVREISPPTPPLLPQISLNSPEKSTISLRAAPGAADEHTPAKKDDNGDRTTKQTAANTPKRKLPTVKKPKRQIDIGSASDSGRKKPKRTSSAVTEMSASGSRQEQKEQTASSSASLSQQISQPKPTHQQKKKVETTAAEKEQKDL